MIENLTTTKIKIYNKRLKIKSILINAQKIYNLFFLKPQFINKSNINTWPLKWKSRLNIQGNQNNY